MKRFVLAIALTCALAGTAMAGEIPSTGINAEEPPAETESLGEIPSTGFTSETLLDAFLWSLFSAI